MTASPTPPGVGQPERRGGSPRTNVRGWAVAIPLDPAHELPLYLQIAGSISADIARGRLRSGQALPGSRTLARSLGVHRNTILAAYTELATEGWVTTELAGGTFVARNLPVRVGRAPGGPAGQGGVAMQPGFALEAPLPYDRPPAYAPGMLVLAKGAPDIRLLPTVELARAYRRVLARDGRRLLTYGDPRGHPRLRAALGAMLSAARGVLAGSDSIMVTRGSQMALDLAARALVRPGDRVAVEALGHRSGWAAFRLAGAQLVAVPVDEDGLCVAALEAAVGEGPIRAVYCTPHHQFPTTTVMPAARRTALLDLARRHRIAIIEDDYDHEFSYESRPVLPLASADGAGVVVYIGTLSKILAPGLRMGFVVAPPPVIERMTSLRVVSDLQGDLAVECALADLFETGELARHVRRMRRTYWSRRDALAAALRRELGGAIDFEMPSGGMALWARVAPEIDVDEWAHAALAAGVAFRGGRMYDFRGESRPEARLGFTYHDEGELAEAARRMARALATVRERSPNVGRLSERRDPSPGPGPAGR